MSDAFVLTVIMRWIHIVTAVVVAGGILYYCLVFVPVARRVLSEEEQEKLREPLMRRWKMFIHPPVILFLISGFYNYLFVTRFAHEGQGLYHALLGVKILLALGVFGLAITMTSTMAWSEKIRKNQGLWLALVLMTTAVILLAGYLRVMPTSELGVTATGAAPLPEWQE